MSESLYWDSFLQKEESFYDINRHKFLKKGYTHFDNRIWFPTYKNNFKKFLADKGKVATHSFYPFLKIELATKRIRYDPKKHRRVKNVKIREIQFAAHFDSLVYSYYSSVLDHLFEAYLKQSAINKSVIAYRSLGLSNIEFASEIFSEITKFNKEFGDTVVIALDVKSFFDSLDHEHLKKAWLHLLKIVDPALTKLPDDHYNIFKSITQYSSVRKLELLPVLGIPANKKSKKVFRYCNPEGFRNIVRKSKIIRRNENNFGIPQGSPISAILSNIYMSEYDEHIQQLSDSFPLIYRRYCDDILLVCKKENYLELKDKLYTLIAQYKLTIQPEKEDIVLFSVDKGQLHSTSVDGKQKKLQYLGFDFDGQRTFIRSSSLSRYHRKMKASARQLVRRAYGRRSQGNRIFRRKINNQYTHLGSRNFITYALRSADIMNSDSIRRQISKHVSHLNKTIKKKKVKHEEYLVRKGRTFKSMQ